MQQRIMHFPRFEKPESVRAVHMCVRTKTFTVYLRDNQCVVYSFGERSPVQMREHWAGLDRY